MNRLRERMAVTVNLPRGSAPVRAVDFECTVLALDGSRAILEPFQVLPEAIPARLEQVLLAFEHGRSLVGLKGVLTRHGSVLAFAVSDGVEVPRRRVPRLEAQLAVEARNLRTGGEATGVTRDVSVDGALLETALDAITGDRLAVSLAVPGAEPVVLTGVVVRATAGLVAVSYADPRAGARDALEAFIAARSQPAAPHLTTG